MRVGHILCFNLLTHSRTNEYLSRIGFILLLGAVFWYPGVRDASLQQVTLYALSIGIGVLLTMRGYHSTSRYRHVVTTFYLLAGSCVHVMIPEVS